MNCNIFFDCQLLFSLVGFDCFCDNTYLGCLPNSYPLQVQIFWEGHKNLKKKNFLNLLSNVKFKFYGILLRKPELYFKLKETNSEFDFQGVDNWNFDTFALHRVSKGTPLRYLGYELLTRHGCLHKYKVKSTLNE